MSDDAKNDEPIGALTRTAGLPAVLAAAVLLLAVNMVLLLGLTQLWPADQVIKPLLSSNAHFLGWQGVLTGQEQLLWLMAFAGGLGGGVHSLRSMAWYVGQRQLHLGWLFYYLLAPVVGAILGVLPYLLLRAALLPELARDQTLSPFGFVALAALLGLFSREAAASLSGVFLQVFTNAERQIERRTDESARILAKTVEQDLTRSFSALLSGPLLDNYTGFVSIRFENDREMRLPLSDGTPVARPGTTCSLVVTFQGDRPEEPATQEVNIRDGENLPEVGFRLQAESESLDFEPPHHDTLVPATGHPTSVAFSVRIPTREREHELWMNILQKGRLVQVVSARIAVRNSRSG